MNWILTWLPTLVTFSPLVGLLVLLLLSRDKKGWHRWVTVLASLIPLGLASWMYVLFDIGSKSMQFTQKLDWFKIWFTPEESWTFTYSMGVDGLSMPLVLLTALITTLAIYASRTIKEHTKSYYSLLLLLEVGMLGVFLANTLFLFFIFFEITLVSTFFLIGRWGFLSKEKAANHFLLYNGLGSGFLLFAMIGLFLLTQSLDYQTLEEVIPEYLTSMDQLEPVLQTLVWGTFISLLIAFGIKLPIFPFHSWMLRVHVEAPLPVVMIHSGILLKMGAYGLLRFNLGLFPTMMKEISTIILVIGLIGIIYGAILAFVETDLKKVLAYSSVSHMGIILLGISAFNEIGTQGALFQAVSHGLISALLFYLVSSLYERTKTTQLDELGGLAKAMPRLSGYLLFAGMALLGLPGLSGFISELMAFVGLFQVRPIFAAVGTLGLILAAVYALRAILKITFGPIRERHEPLSDLKWQEVGPIWVLVGFIVLIGVYPAILGDPMQQTLQLLVSKMGG
ncbi:complex I subunit 4 family protein [Hazenella coriacea]|uniref:NADH-quinone oxidoreductase subunit M n=1 Tax=Hazenella coriacea TaxID=1179467 RepID=A0A4V2UVF5_9BACL|nr:NADH-quinone oxidoreductase subunit M [Hazenella coriacea]TCS95607.1 NADH-quinone oxidoreductase subunit M [Hazenella coriacea]